VAGELCRHTVPVSHGSTAISGKFSLAFLLDLYLYFPGIPRILLYVGFVGLADILLVCWFFFSAICSCSVLKV
jgi:hypothetical protein